MDQYVKLAKQIDEKLKLVGDSRSAAIAVMLSDSLEEIQNLIAEIEVLPDKPSKDELADLLVVLGIGMDHIEHHVKDAQEAMNSIREDGMLLGSDKDVSL